MANTRKEVYLIINPVSGTSSKNNIPDIAEAILNEQGMNVSIFRTEYAGHGAEIAKRAVAEGIDYVVAVGGDGTVNEVARSLVGSKTALGIVPLGSGNGLGRDLQISTNAKKALKIIAEENVINIDYGIANGNVFFCTCGVGFDAEVAAKAAGNKKRGTLMYVKHMLESYFTQIPQTYEIICPEGTIKDKAFVVTCANASQYGYEAHIAPHADIKDGKMNIIILKPLSIIDVPQTSIRLFTSKLGDDKNMIELITNKVTIKREKAGVMHIDGDPIPMGKEIDVEIIPGGLRVLVPKDPEKRHPLSPQEILLRVLSVI